LIAMKMVVPTEELATKHYYDVGGDEWLENVGIKARAAYEKKGMQSPYATNKDNGWAVLKANAKYLSSGPVICMIWEGNQACAIVRKLTGTTEPLSSDVGTIRGDFTIDSYQLSDVDQRSVRNMGRIVPVALLQLQLGFERIKKILVVQEFSDRLCLCCFLVQFAV